MYSKNQIGPKLREVRDGLGWTVYQAAEKSVQYFKEGKISKKFTAGQVSNWENAERGTSPERLAEILKVYGISSLLYFFSLFEEPRETVDITNLPKAKQQTIRQLVNQLSPEEKIEEKKKEKAPPYAKDPPGKAKGR